VSAEIVAFACLSGHWEALELLGRQEALIDTCPCSGGLMARKAAAMGIMRVKTFTGELFCERHSLHLKTS
jgi:predicted glycosyltransferase